MHMNEGNEFRNTGKEVKVAETTFLNYESRFDVAGNIFTYTCSFCNLENILVLTKCVNCAENYYPISNERKGS